MMGNKCSMIILSKIDEKMNKKIKINEKYKNGSEFIKLLK